MFECRPTQVSVTEVLGCPGGSPVSGARATAEGVDLPSQTVGPTLHHGLSRTSTWEGRIDARYQEQVDADERNCGLTS
jgi:hypothetical protein